MFDRTVLDVHGAPHRLGDHIERGPVLLALLRQYGCVGCNQMVTRLAPRLHELDRLGVQAVFVGLGEPAHLEAFVERMHLHDKRVQLFTSPDGAAHEAAGVPRSAWGSIGPKSLWQRLQLLSEGFVSGAVTGDAFRMSGVLLLRDGVEVWRHIGDSPAGHPDHTLVLQRALALVAA